MIRQKKRYMRKNILKSIVRISIITIIGFCSWSCIFKLLFKSNNWLELSFFSACYILIAEIYEYFEKYVEYRIKRRNRNNKIIKINIKEEEREELIKYYFIFDIVVNILTIFIIGIILEKRITIYIVLTFINLSIVKYFEDRGKS